MVHEHVCRTLRPLRNARGDEIPGGSTVYVLAHGSQREPRGTCDKCEALRFTGGLQFDVTWGGIQIFDVPEIYLFEVFV